MIGRGMETGRLSGSGEAIKTIAGGRRKDNFVVQIGEIERGRDCQSCPVSRGQIRILLQHKIRGRHDPRKGEFVGRRRDVQLRQRNGL